ncbi:MAG: hypothetical protein NBV68_12725 [Erythrobacter sp.]|uniref:hypothetical protein n=1 Tax=Erythrobacter sp. TaxID=1042 RepID=UPI0025D27649|nr:hypothetical protein [Erythrobacter sp.]MCM0000242.1 hypothetical protein [Erythrobacter sp.]
MIGMRYVALAFAALALAAVPVAAAAQGEAVHRFTVSGKAFTVPVPQGYCLPSGGTVALAAKVASLDTMNLTHANLDRCGTFGEDYVHIKSPRRPQPVPMPRAQFLALLARELQTANGQKLVDDAIENAGRDVAKGTNNEVQLDNAVPRFVGQDDNCVYMALVSDVVGALGAIKIRGVICMTVVGGEFMNVNAYAIEGRGTTEAQLKARVRAIALSIAAAGA